MSPSIASQLRHILVAREQVQSSAGSLGLDLHLVIFNCGFDVLLDVYPPEAFLLKKLDNLYFLETHISSDGFELRERVSQK
jgi:hypothetical protein